MFTVAMSFDEAYASLTSQLDAVYMRLRQTPGGIPPRLFHYTTAEGLNGLTDSKVLWASNARFLNDLSEPAYATDVLKQAISTVRCKHKIEGHREVKQLLGNFWNAAEQQSLKEGPDAYVFCFCENGDLLSQWRGYADRGRGFAVGFDTTAVVSLLDRSNGQYLVRVVYDREKQACEAEDAIGQICKILADLEDSVGSLDGFGSDAAHRIRRAVYNAVFAEAVRLQTAFKDPAFQEEREWRIVQFVHPKANTPTICFRGTGSGILPYLKIGLHDSGPDRTPVLPLDSVVYGPTLDPSVTEEVLRLLLMKRGYAGAAVTKSKVPFRF